MGRTHTNSFTKEQIDHLKVNHYVKSISSSTIRFTEEFKKYFYEHYHSDMSARQIFTDCGIDPDVLGDYRIKGFCYTLNKQARRDSGFSDNRAKSRRNPPKNSEPTLESRVSQLEHELAYARQEVEFLKKMQMADMEARRQWESRHQPK